MVLILGEWENMLINVMEAPVILFLKNTAHSCPDSYIHALPWCQTPSHK